MAVKRATIEGYYTSAIGIHQGLQYQGNTALSEFPGCGSGAQGLVLSRQSTVFCCCAIDN